MRRVVSIVVAALALSLVPSVAPTSSVHAAPSDVVAIVIEGTGFGHGRGMSQWGAYGWAVDEDKSWQWILDHYYGGTTLTDVDTSRARIRVRLLGLDGLGTVGVTAGSGSVTAGAYTRRSLYAREVSANRFEIYGSNSMACPGSSTLTVPDGPIARNSSNSTAVRQIQTFLNAYRISGDDTLAVDGAFGPLTEARLRDWQGDQGLPVDGVWHTSEATRARQLIGQGGAATWSLLGTVTGPVTFTSPNGENSQASPSSVLGVCDASGEVTHYRGRIEVRSESAGNRVVNDVKTEDYLRGVVPKEISASWADAGNGRGANAVRAQAVAARSYGLQQNRYVNEGGYASICDTQSCQVYFGSASRASASSSAVLVEDPRTDAAIAATAGKVRTFPGGAIASTEFSASNGPRTAGGVFPVVNDVPGDGTERNPNHRWTRVLDADVLAARYGLGSITSASMVEAASSTYRQFDGIWFNDVVFTGSNGNTFRQQAWDFRGANGLPSPGFTVRVVTEDTTSTSFAMIGDSVGSSVAASSSSEFRVLTDGTFPSARYDTRSSRCTVTTSCPGTSGVEAAGAVPTGTDLVVVQLGYNDWPPSFAGHIDQMMAALAARDVGHVAWVNLAEIRGTGGSYYRQSNDALRAATSRHRNLTVLDWEAASSNAERARWFADEVHLTSTGQAEFAAWLRSEVLELAPSVGARLAPPRRLEIPVVGETVTFPDGTTGVVPPSAGAVAVNAVAVEPSANGFVSLWPCGVPRPEASSLNYRAGGVVSNGVIAPVGEDGTVCLYSHQSTDIVLDVTGWFDTAAPGGGGFTAITPFRAADSRTGAGIARTRLTPGQPVRVQIAGLAVRRPDGSSVAIPTDASAAAVNVVAIDPDANGWLALYPCGPLPTASTLNYVAGEVRANGALATLDGDGGVCIATHRATDVLLDVTGWFSAGADPASTTLVAADPTRWVDTRIGTGAPARPLTRTTPLEIPIVGRNLTVEGRQETIPSSVVAVAVNASAVQPGQNGFTTMWPCGQPMPTASSINYRPGRATANNALVPVGADGSICLHVHNTTDVVVDVTGWINDTGGFVGVVPSRSVDTRIGVGPRPV